MKRFAKCSVCRLEEKLTRKGLIKRHPHYWLPGLRCCPGSRRAPYAPEGRVAR